MSARSISVILLLSLFHTNCTKSISGSTGTASLTIVNAINNNSAIITDFEPIGPKGIPNSLPNYFANAGQIWYGSYLESGSYVDQTHLTIFQNNDTAASLWTGDFKFMAGSIQTLYLGGSITKVDTLLTIDQIPYYPPGDSVAGVRFVNLILGAQPIAINIAGNPPDQTEFNNIDYRQTTSFRQYPANRAVPGSYTFEIRNQSTDSLLATFNWPYTVFRNNTLVLIGSQLQTSAQPIQVLAVNNF